MKVLELDIHEDVISAIDRLKKTQDLIVEIVIPEGSVLFENSLNIKLIKKEAKRFNKVVSFRTDDSDGLNILATIDEADSIASGSAGSLGDFVSKEVPIEQVIDDISTKRGSFLSGFSKWNPFSFSFLKSLKLFRLPKISLKFKFLPTLLVTVFLGGLGYGGYWYYWNVPKFEIGVIVESQPLVQSIQLQTADNLETDVDKKILKGKMFVSSVTKSKSTKTTGTKIVGEKAEGKIKIINKTTVSKSFEDGDDLYYESDDGLIFELTEDVTVPPAKVKDDTVPLSKQVLVPGSNIVKVEAKEIGSDHNLDEGEILEFEDYSSTSYVAEVFEDIDGGSREVLSIVTQKDLDLISTELLEEIKGEKSDSVKDQVSGDWVYIKGSESNELTKEEFDHKVGDEAKEVKVTQSVVFKGLAYNKKELEKMVGPILDKFVPKGFEISSEDTDVKVEVLGNSNETVLSSSKADLQVTLKTYVIPKVDESKIRQDLVGVSFESIEDIVKDVPNVITYSFKVKKQIPLFNRITKNAENIFVDIERK